MADRIDYLIMQTRGMMRQMIQDSARLKQIEERLDVIDARLQVIEWPELEKRHAEIDWDIIEGDDVDAG